MLLALAAGVANSAVAYDRGCTIGEDEALGIRVSQCTSAVGLETPTAESLCAASQIGFSCCYQTVATAADNTRDPAVPICFANYADAQTVIMKHYNAFLDKFGIFSIEFPAETPESLAECNSNAVTSSQHLTAFTEVVSSKHEAYTFLCNNNSTEPTGACEPDANGMFSHELAKECMSQLKTVPHPGLCPLDAVCASFVRSANNSWLCHDGAADPTQCDADKERIMLLGRKTRSGVVVQGQPTPCINNGDCGATERCYARRCDTARTPGADEERLYAYINGACGTISPHVRAELDVGSNTAVGPLVTVRCVVDKPDDLNDWRVLMTLAQEWVHRETYSGDQYLDGDVSTNVFGQLQVRGTSSINDDLVARRFDTRAKAEACSLCSLYTARNSNTAAFVTEDKYWECSVYQKGQNPPSGALNCTEIFGNNIYVAREGVRELETIGFAEDDVAPAYLASGIVPRSLNQEWQAFTLAPPLFTASGELYVSGASTDSLYGTAEECTGFLNNELQKIPNCRRKVSALQLPHVDGLFYQFADLMHEIPEHNRVVHPQFDRIWGFLNYAAGPEDYRSSLDTGYRGSTQFFNPVPDLNFMFLSGARLGGNVVTDAICADQMTYCCPSGPDLTGRTITLNSLFTYNRGRGEETLVQTDKGSIRCGHANTRFYGLNHAFRASTCPIAGGNWPPTVYDGDEFTYREGSLRLDAAKSTELFGQGVDFIQKYAADVLVVPRTWQSGCNGTTLPLECTGKVAYGWALLDDLRDVDRTRYNAENTLEAPASCKHLPQQHDYCLRRDRGFASNTVREELGGHRCVMPLGSTVGDFGDLLQTIGTKEDICCDTDEAETCDPACLAYVTGDATTASTTPTSTTTTQVPVVQDDIVRALVMYNNDFDGAQDGQPGTAFEREVPGTSDAVCAVKYRYAATDMAEPLAVLTYSDASVTAHTQCRDYCTAWDRCVAYSYADPPDTTCRLYGNMSVPGPLDYRHVDANLGMGNSGWRYTTDEFGNDNLVVANPFATAVIEAFSAQVSLATSFDKRAVLRELVRGGNDGTVASFDFYHGVVPCNIAGLNVTVVQTLTLNECTEQARSAQAESFYWEGRLYQCTLIFNQLAAPAAVSWTCDTPLALCSDDNRCPPEYPNQDEFINGGGGFVQRCKLQDGDAVAHLRVTDEAELHEREFLCQASDNKHPCCFGFYDSDNPQNVLCGSTMEDNADFTYFENNQDYFFTDCTESSCAPAVDCDSSSIRHVQRGAQSMAAVDCSDVCEPPAFRYVDYGERVGVFAKRAANTCPASLTTTTTTETASVAPAVLNKVTFYTSLPQWCDGVTEPLYISPVYTDEMDGLRFYDLETPVTGIRPVTIDSEVIGNISYSYSRLYWDPKDPPARPCLDTPPADRTVYGEVDTTTAASTTTTSSTPTFVNRFTEEDTNVAIGVAIGVLGLGVLLTLIAARG
jgi:hypothetical protein